MRDRYVRSVRKIIQRRDRHQQRHDKVQKHPDIAGNDKTVRHGIILFVLFCQWLAPGINDFNKVKLKKYLESRYTEKDKAFWNIYKTTGKLNYRYKSALIENQNLRSDIEELKNSNNCWKMSCILILIGFSLLVCCNYFYANL